MSVQKSSGATARFARYQAEQAKQNRRQKNSFRNDFRDNQKGGKIDVINRDRSKPQ